MQLKTIFIAFVIALAALAVAVLIVKILYKLFNKSYDAPRPKRRSPGAWL